LTIDDVRFHSSVAPFAHARLGCVVPLRIQSS